MITHLEGTYRIVSADDKISKHISWHDTLKEKAPDVCDELDDLMQNILDHALNHSGDGEKFGAKFVELVKKAEKAKRHLWGYSAKLLFQADFCCCLWEKITNSNLKLRNCQS